LIMAELFIPGDIVGALEAAAVTVGRLDAVLAGNPLRRAWTFWSELDAARRHAEADGRKVDLFRLAAHLHGLPLRLGDGASAPERGTEIAGLNHAIELRSWMAAPDAGQSALREAALDSLRACGCGQPVLIAAARGMLDWLAGRRSRPASRTAIPLYLRERETTIHGLAAVTGGDALRPGASDPDGFTVRFVEAVRREAADGRDRLLTMEREWREARLRVDHRAGRIPGCRRRSICWPPRRCSASPPWPRRWGLLGRGGVADAGHPGPARGRRRGDRPDRAGRAAALRAQAPAADPGRDDRRPAKGGRCGRPKRVLTAPFAELATQPDEGAVAPNTEPVEPARLAPVSFDFDALDRLIVAADERTRGVRRLLDRVARGEKPFPPGDRADEPEPAGS